MDWFQGSLLDCAPTAEGGIGAEACAPLSGHASRVQLGSGAWVDVLPGWIRGADALFERLLDTVPWRSEKRQMYDRVVDVPRLVSHFGANATLPDELLSQARARLNEHYAQELGEPFRTAGLCLYRDGNDSVAWHGDRIGRGRDHDTMVAIVSLGSPRQLSLRPRGGGAQTSYALGHGDLLVMGGSCQRTFDHAVLKTAKAVGPRISVQFRPAGVL